MSSNALSGSLRLLFEPLKADHAPELFEPLGDPRAWEHINETPPTTVTGLAGRFACMASGPPPDRVNERWLNYVIRLRTDGTLIGRLQATIIARRAEIAYLLGPRFWGLGYATEAMSAFQDNLRQQEDVAEFWATTAPGNTRSIRLLQRLRYVQLSDSWPPLMSYESGDLVFVLR